MTSRARRRQPFLDGLAAFGTVALWLTAGLFVLFDVLRACSGH